MFVADLHIHSRFSRATSRSLDAKHLYEAAQRKGVGVVGTGDFTHPVWREELREHLVPAEEGLFRLSEERARAVDAELPPAVRSNVRFMLSAEISNIYKRGGKVRKVHNVVLAPSFESATNIGEELGRLGNVTSDGRPILGLDSRDLLEIVLEKGEGAVLIPAHIWTPWFSALGMKSGFESIDACYGDLAEHIFAVETGLSSDPPMNWRVSSLDRFALVSNSDAHSPGKLAREANLFDCELGFEPMIEALRTREGFRGTLEFYPEEGKYHLDGHRKCDVRLTPEETVANGGLCPVCGKPVTVGVQHRVHALADHEPGRRPERAADFESIVPLPELVGEAHGVGSGSKRVARDVLALTSALGSELCILREQPLEDIERVSSALIAEAVRRARMGEVDVAGGYDGEYGVVRVFKPEERRELGAQRTLFVAPAPKPTTGTSPEDGPKSPATGNSGYPIGSEECPRAEPMGQLGLFAPQPTPSDRLLGGLNEAQHEAVTAPAGPLLIQAGPGTGKTRTLTHRIAWRIEQKDIVPEDVLAITFTNKAAEELRVRLRDLLGFAADAMTIATFHAAGLKVLREEAEAAGLPSDPLILGDEGRLALLETLDGAPKARRERRELLDRISSEKQKLDGESDELSAAYEERLRSLGCLDLDDLVLLPTRVMRDDAALAGRLRARWKALFVDEYQDVNPVQADWLRRLAGERRDITAIGDPDQAIYGFRGAEVALFHRFATDYPGTTKIALSRSYRSTEAILAPARQVLGGAGELWSGIEGGVVVRFVESASEKAEAEQVAHAIEKAVGGTAFFSMDTERVGADDGDELSFGDIAVLYRTKDQAAPVAEALERLGVPIQVAGRREEPEADHEAMDALKRAFAVGEPITDVDLKSRLSNGALQSEQDGFDPRAERVVLMTLHASKGLEFPMVFIVGCEDGYLPMRRGDEDPSKEQIEEEKRLLYVGMTRAERQLTLLHAKRRLRFGQRVERAPSPFLCEVEDVLLHREHSRYEKKKEEPEPQLTLF